MANPSEPACCWPPAVYAVTFTAPALAGDDHHGLGLQPPPWLRGRITKELADPAEPACGWPPAVYAGTFPVLCILQQTVVRGRAAPGLRRPNLEHLPAGLHPHQSLRIRTVTDESLAWAVDSPAGPSRKGSTTLHMFELEMPIQRQIFNTACRKLQVHGCHIFRDHSMDTTLIRT